VSDDIPVLGWHRRILAERMKAYQAYPEEGRLGRRSTRISSVSSMIDAARDEANPCRSPRSAGGKLRERSEES
jgi:hypothetical protein